MTEERPVYRSKTEHVPDYKIAADGTLYSRQVEQERRKAKMASLQNLIELARLEALAKKIGDKVANGDLPPQDENGFYIYPTKEES